MFDFQDWEFYVAFACVIGMFAVTVLGVGAAVFGFYWTGTVWMLGSLLAVFIAMVVKSEMP